MICRWLGGALDRGCMEPSLMFLEIWLGGPPILIHTHFTHVLLSVVNAIGTPKVVSHKCRAAETPWINLKEFQRGALLLLFVSASS